MIESCMGTDWGDVDRDRDFDRFVAKRAMETATLFRRNPDGAQSDCTAAMGLGRESRYRRGDNSRAIGPRGECITTGLRQLKEVGGAASYAAWSDSRVVLGLGD